MATPPKSIPTLPPKAIIEILSRAGARSLSICSCVCRLWCSLISNPIFIQISRANQPFGYPKGPKPPHDCLLEIFNKLPPPYLNWVLQSASESELQKFDDLDYTQQYLKFNLANNPLLIFRFPEGVGLLNYDSRSPIRVLIREPKVSSSNLTFPEFSREMILAGSFNGIVCASNRDKSTVVLWNPSLGLWKPIVLPQTKSVFSVGLGFDQLSSDYKIFCIEPALHGSRVHMYSNNEDLWTSKSIIPFSPLEEEENCNFMVKGVPYWICTEYDEEEPKDAVVVLGRVNPSTGLFRCFNFPDSHLVGVVNWKDSVASFFRSSNMVVRMYVMDEDDRWVMLYNFRIGNLWEVIRIPQCLATGEVVMLSVLRYCLDTRFICPESDYFTYDGELETLCPIWEQSYRHVESFIRLKGMVKIVQHEENALKRLEWLNEDFKSVLRGYECN